jgi:hypothetical protein
MVIRYNGTSTITVHNWTELLTLSTWQTFQADQDVYQTLKANSQYFEIVEWNELLWDNVLQVSEVTLTAAQVLASFTTPIALVAAPASWKYTVVDKVTVSVDYNSAAYATNTTLEIRYTNWSWTKVTADVAWILTATADKAVSVWWIEAELVHTAAAAVVVCTATWNPITWNSPIKIRTLYRTLTI